MPLFALICRDNPGLLDTRKANRERHLAYIKDTGVVRIAGPILENGDMCGSIVVIEADDMAGAQAWADADPYKAADLFQNVEIFEWKQVV